jgi:hypothetical protein
MALAGRATTLGTLRYVPRASSAKDIRRSGILFSLARSLVREKKPAWPNTPRHSITPAYSSTDLPALPGCPLVSRPTAIALSLHHSARITSNPLADIRLFSRTPDHDCGQAEKHGGLGVGCDQHISKCIGPRPSIAAPFARSLRKSATAKLSLIPRKTGSCCCARRKSRDGQEKESQHNGGGKDLHVNDVFSLASACHSHVILNSKIESPREFYPNQRRLKPAALCKKPRYLLQLRIARRMVAIRFPLAGSGLSLSSH